jgi:hypothetical protein
MAMTDKQEENASTSTTSTTLRDSLLVATYEVILTAFVPKLNLDVLVLALMQLVAVGLVIYLLINNLRRNITIFFFIPIVVLPLVLLYNLLSDAMTVPSAIRTSREEVRTIELALDRGFDRDVCSLETATAGFNITLWMRHDSMTLEPLVEDKETARGVSRIFITNGRVVAVQAPDRDGFSQTYYNGSCIIGVDYLDENRSVRELEYVACGQDRKRKARSNTLFWDTQPFKEPPEARPCNLVSLGEEGPTPSLSVLPNPTLGIPYYR